MIPALLPLALLMSFDPPDSDLERWMDLPVWSQAQLCCEHEDRLRMLRAVHGWSDGLWDSALELNTFNLQFWRILKSAREDNWQGDGIAGRRLAELRNHIGPVLYYTGWHPPLYEGDILPRMTLEDP